jgi:hypothetical protein
MIAFSKPIPTSDDTKELVEKYFDGSTEQAAEPASPAADNESTSLPVVYVSKTSLERATTDDANIVKKSRDEYVAEFRLKLVKTARSIIEMCRIVYEAERSLDSWAFKDFCTEIGYSPKSSTIRKYLAIGKVYPRLVEHAEQLPASWTSIYLLTQIPADDFERLATSSSLSDATGAELNELVRSTRPMDSLAAPLPIDRGTGNLIFGKLMFTKKPDDTDWRAMLKALAEVEARLPVRFAVNKEAQSIWEDRKLSRYEQRKSQYESIEFTPEKWDFGRDANVVDEAATGQSVAA